MSTYAPSVPSFFDGRLTPESLSLRAQDIARVCERWQAVDCEERLRATQYRVEAGLDRERVDSQLVRIAGWDQAMLLDLVRRELGDDLRSAVGPRRVLHLASGSVPGLSIDSVIPTLMLGSHQLVRCSADDTEFCEFLDLINRVAPDLSSSITLVETVDWTVPDAAVVWGTDATIALVRHKLGQSAPVAAFGQRTSIAIIQLSTEMTPTKLAAMTRDLETDLCMFNGAGCMTPQQVFVIDDAGDDRSLVERLNALEVPWTHITDLAELEDQLSSVSNALQTVTIGATEDGWPRIARVAVEAGATRVCTTGMAHKPPLTESHDGRGRLRDLVRWISSDGSPLLRV